MKNRQDSLTSLSSSDNDLSETGSEGEEVIVMRWVSSGNQMLARALSRNDINKEEKYRSSYVEQQVPCDPKIAKLKERLREKEKLLYQLEKQEKDFLGKDNQNEDPTIFRIEFESTTCKDYLLVPGCPESLIPAGKSVAIFGQLRNKRWRCAVKNGDHRNNDSEIPSRKFSDASFYEDSKKKIIPEGNDHRQSDCCCPLIGSIPSSIIVELSEGININKIDHDATGDEESSSPDKEKDRTMLTLCECGRQISESKNSLSRIPSCSFCQYCNTPGPVQAVTPELLQNLPFQKFSSASSTPLPTLPESPTETTIAQLNMALESLAKITRPVSGGSDSSRSSWASRF